MTRPTRDPLHERKANTLRRIITAITAFAMALSMLATAQAAPAAAVAGYDSDYFGESAFLNLAPGQAGQFAVGFNNTGATGWQLGTSSQVNLGICQADKTTCNTTSPNAAWASNWYSSIAYATQSTNFVGPGQTGWFVYAVRAPSTATTGTTARFNGDLVLHSTLQQLHPQGYYQDATVSGTATVPTQMTLTPTFQGKQIGQTATLTANVTADPPTGSTTRQPAPNTEVTFQVPASGLNPAITATAITDSAGNATFSYTRNNPGTDTVTAYVTGAPTVRATATVTWGTAANTIAVTPDDAVTMPNTTVGSSSSCRTYTISAQDINGAGISTVVGNFLENLVTSANTAASGGNADAKDGGATIGGAAVANGTNYTIALAGATATTPGTGTVAVCGNGSTKTVTLLVWQDSTADTYFSGELGDAGGSITFQSRVPSIAVTPDTASSMAAGGQRVFTLTATDQFGSPFGGTVTIGTVENTDDLAGTSSPAVVSWWDNTLASGALQTTGSAGCGTAPAGASSGAVGTASVTTAAPEATTGQLTFALCSATAGSGTAVGYQEKAGGLTGTREADETAGDTGGSTTWAAAALTSCTLTASKSTTPTSAAADTAVATLGDVVLTFTYRDQSGNAFDPTDAVVTFSVTNNTTASIASRAEGQGADTAIAAGATTSQPTAAAITDTDATLAIDATTAGTVSVTATSTSGSTTVTCGPTVVTYVQATDAATTPGSGGTVTGTVIFKDNGASTTDGIGAYVLQTTLGNYYITFDMTADTYVVTGTTTTGILFEGQLSLGDVITVNVGAAQPAGAWGHNMTTNAP